MVNLGFKNLHFYLNLHWKDENYKVWVKSFINQAVFLFKELEKNSIESSKAGEIFGNNDEINIDDIRSQLLSLQSKLNKKFAELQTHKTISTVEENLINIRKKLDSLTESTQHIPAIPLAPPPPVPPANSSLNISLEEKQEYEKQGKFSLKHLST